MNTNYPKTRCKIQRKNLDGNTMGEYEVRLQATTSLPRRMSALGTPPKHPLSWRKGQRHWEHSVFQQHALKPGKGEKHLAAMDGFKWPQKRTSFREKQLWGLCPSKWSETTAKPQYFLSLSPSNLFFFCNTKGTMLIFLLKGMLNVRPFY